MESFICPTKVIFAGEHFVVHGEKAIAMAVLPYNELSISKSSSLELLTPWGTRNESDLNFFLMPVVEYLREKGLDYFFRLEFKVNGFKGMGNSASCAALAATALLEANGIDDPVLARKLAFKCENLAHGGKASGVDLFAVLSKKPVLFWKDGEKRIFEETNFAIPLGSELVVTSTLKPGMDSSSTASMIRKFADSYGSGLAEVREQYRELYGSIDRSINDPGSLGELMNEMNRLLIPVSTPAIEEVRSLSISQGAYGSKLSGAGGAGSIVISLCSRNDSSKIISALKEKGYPSFVSRPVEGGVRKK